MDGFLLMIAGTDRLLLGKDKRIMHATNKRKDVEYTQVI